jgi:signal transduction histidine kinase/CheY-like chemotaxis protein
LDQPPENAEAEPRAPPVRPAPATPHGTKAADGNHGALVASMHESQKLLDLAQEAGAFGIFEWRVQTGTVQLSPKVCSLYGLTDFDGQYETWLGRVFREDVARVKNDIQAAFDGHKSEVVQEFRIVRSDDQTVRWIERHGIIAYDPDGHPERLVGVSFDVTQKKRMMVQLRAFTDKLEESVRERTWELEAENKARGKAEELLRQAQKMEAVGQLTGGVAHDFNNLLTIILGGLQIIELQSTNLPVSPATLRIARAGEMALKGVHRAALLTHRLLAFSRQQPLSPLPIEANVLVSGIFDLLRRTIGEVVSLETVMADGLWKAHADPNQLENAIVNLVVNARDAMPNGGKLTIETSNCSLDETYTGTLSEPIAAGEYVMIAVSDTGVGMDAATLVRAFEPFFTTKGVGKGTGLGLSQVYGFVRQSDGHVQIYSEPSQGTTVRIYLPRYLGTDKWNRPALTRLGSPRAVGTECILVVEDDDVLRAYTAEVLSELGYYVLEAKDGLEALGVLERTPQLDLLFTDIVLPGGMNGRELADAFLSRKSGVKVLFTSGYSRDAFDRHGRGEPGADVISKPFSREALASKVRDVLDGDER